jgi:2-hydroxy-3-keto-5-methylthiopentenyl-1-phosphate phosphatase
MPEIITPPEAKTFYVTVEQIFPRVKDWWKSCEVNEIPYVVTDLTTESTVESLVKKLQEQERKVKKFP